MDPNTLESGDLIKINNPGYELRTCIGEFTCYWTPTTLGEKAKKKEWVMIQFPGYTAQRCFEKNQCLDPTQNEIKEHFAQKLKYGD